MPTALAGYRKYLIVPKKRPGLHAKSPGESGDIVDGHVPFRPLDRTQISAIHTALVGECFLAKEDAYPCP